MNNPRKYRRSPKDNREGEKHDDEDEYLFQKRLPPSLPKRKNDVYVNQKTPFIAQFNKCKKLLTNEREVYIHGLGAAVNTAVNLALQLKTYFLDNVTLDPTTSSVELLDDYIPLTSKGKFKTSSRKNSAIHIKLTHLVQAK